MFEWVVWRREEGSCEVERWHGFDAGLEAISVGALLVGVRGEYAGPALLFCGVRGCEGGGAVIDQIKSRGKDLGALAGVVL